MNAYRDLIVLASSSPRRRELLAGAGYRFEVIHPHESAECGICSKETPPELVARLALQKAHDVAIRADVESRSDVSIVVGCDTVAECLGQILGKPKNREHAAEMLRHMSGRVHHVYSGVCLMKPGGGEPHAQVAATKLRMDDLSNEQIEEYLDTNLWQGKAGAFGYQDGLGWVHVVEGSESNVVGLPLELLSDMLAQSRSQ
ncbi:MAG: Maf family protein [Pirellulales bacterium]|nr:Maf family protein [Pirellulales bacterium]